MSDVTAVRVKRARIPKRLAPFFQEYDLKKLNLEQDANLVIQRTLEYGTSRETQWLFRVYDTTRIKQFVRELGERGLSKAKFNYWRTSLRVRKWHRSPFVVARESVWPYS